MIIKTFSVPATVTHDVEATGGMYVQNAGQGPAGHFTIDFYGSCSNEAFSDAPVEVAVLGPGAEKFVHLKFTFSGTGACSVGARVDYDNDVAETNDSNNEVNVNVTSQ